METTDSIFQRIENTICGGGFEKLGLLSNVTVYRVHTIHTEEVSPLRADFSIIICFGKKKMEKSIL
ncbi:hypothetical protein MTBBW1_1060017 [Desulfamplus magnetovallimortis]|uniref:Uncharacterized protein n=1 Tax=Desulfamplus magnetovallimortis TaxID=1246637 RepID=A0A1W1H5E7_9BACT|nr:hypothetical protein MTBBW1_1060017 [Desulfamplus magnetovallimortis]